MKLSVLIGDLKRVRLDMPAGVYSFRANRDVLGRIVDRLESEGVENETITPDDAAAKPDRAATTVVKSLRRRQRSLEAELREVNGQLGDGQFREIHVRAELKTARELLAQSADLRDRIAAAGRVNARLRAELAAEREYKHAVARGLLGLADDARKILDPPTTPTTLTTT